MNFSLIPFEFEGNQIRQTENGQFSVYDFIRVVGGQKNPHQAWNDLPKMEPECSR